MSMGSEAAVELEIRREIMRAQVEAEAGAGIWTTKDGTRIAVKDMTTSHIRNTIHFLEERNAFDMLLPWICAFKKELERRGEEP